MIIREYCNILTPVFKLLELFIRAHNVPISIMITGEAIGILALCFCSFFFFAPWIGVEFNDIFVIREPAIDLAKICRWSTIFILAIGDGFIAGRGATPIGLLNRNKPFKWFVSVRPIRVALLLGMCQSPLA